MLSKTKSINLTGSSKVTVDGTEVVVATMSASLTADGKLNKNSNVINAEVYEANKEEVVNDLKEFDALAYELGDKEE